MVEAWINALRDALPDERRVGNEILQPGLCVAWEPGEGWEVELCVLDPARNVCLTRPSLLDALKAVADYAQIAPPVENRSGE